MDYYKVLGVKPSASKDEIRRAYHRLALKYHPDKNKSTSAEKHFRSVKEAYEYLRDRRKRREFDESDRDTPNNAKRVYEEELSRVRRRNTELLDEVNNRRQESRKFAPKPNAKIFFGEIYPNVDDDDYEKIVIDRLRSIT